MELLKLDDRPAEFVWNDVRIYFRTKVTVGDKFAIDTAGTHIEGDKVQYKPWDFYLTMIRVFVTGWDGVTEGGNKVAYSYDNLLNRLPSDSSEDLVMKLGLQIAKTNGLIGSENQEAKNA
jgi:hypothetical protein